MFWPPNSPDLNSIEHIWDVMGRQLRVQRPPIHNISDLCDRCLNIWCNLFPVIYQGLVASMSRRVEAVLRAKVGNILWEASSTNSQQDNTLPSELTNKFYNIAKSVVNTGDISWSFTKRQTTQAQATGGPISLFTVARRLHGGGLFARRPVRCVPLTPAHRRRRSLRCREHRNWRDNEWGRVLFTDESTFSLSSDSHRILIWRERGSRNHPSNIIERDRYGGRGVLVWGGIMLGSRTDLHIFDAGSVNGTRYCNEILLPYVRLFRGAMGL
ncbi:transposable element Tcb2 transposase [Trichonephila clavipes]|nr:transposable element Tcb2 transposase [Trichonephila clavipes]